MKASLTLTAALVSTSLLIGCGKKTPKETAPPPPAEASAPQTEPAPPPPGEATAAPAEATEGPAQASNLNPMDYSNASGLTLMVQEYYGKHGRVPKDLNELVAAKMLLKVPTPPPGTKYVIDAKRRQVVIVRAQ
jgi:hypothetical protein